MRTAAFTLVALVTLSQFGTPAAAADKPAFGSDAVAAPAPISSVAEIVAALPKDLAPGREGWTAIQSELVGAWAAKRFADVPVQLTGEVFSVGLKDKGDLRVPYAVIRTPGGKAGALAVSGGSASATFASGAAPGMAKLKPGDRFTFHGAIERVDLAADRTGIAVAVTVKDASPGPRPK